MADALRDAIDGVEVELTEGGKGDFIVLADGRQLWDKKQAGRFPEASEILSQLG